MKSPRIVKIIRSSLALILAGVVYEYLTTNGITFFFQFSTLPHLGNILAQLPLTLHDSLYYQGVGISLYRVLLGVGIASLLAIPIGFIVSQSESAADFIMPLVEIARPIPNVAWVPIAILIVPTIESSIVFITFLGAFFPILLNTIHGIAQIDAKYIQNAKILGLTYIEKIRYLLLPGAFPDIANGIIIGIGTSWLAVIVAESIYGRNGIGYFTFQSLQLVDYPSLFIGIITIGLLGSLSSTSARFLLSPFLVWNTQTRN